MSIRSRLADREFLDINSLAAAIDDGVTDELTPIRRELENIRNQTDNSTLSKELESFGDQILQELGDIRTQIENLSAIPAQSAQQTPNNIDGVAPSLDGAAPFPAQGGTWTDADRGKLVGPLTEFMTVRLSDLLSDRIANDRSDRLRASDPTLNPPELYINGITSPNSSVRTISPQGLFQSAGVVVRNIPRAEEDWWNLLVVACGDEVCTGGPRPLTLRQIARNGRLIDPIAYEEFSRMLTRRQNTTFPSNIWKNILPFRSEVFTIEFRKLDPRYQWRIGEITALGSLTEDGTSTTELNAFEGGGPIQIGITANPGRTFDVFGEVTENPDGFRGSMPILVESVSSQFNFLDIKFDIFRKSTEELGQLIRSIEIENVTNPATIRPGSTLFPARVLVNGTGNRTRVRPGEFVRLTLENINPTVNFTGWTLFGKNDPSSEFVEKASLPAQFPIDIEIDDEYRFLRIQANFE